MFLNLFLTFLKIGVFSFGGGYAMLSLISQEVVIKNKWLTMGQFTDIVAISQESNKFIIENEKANPNKQKPINQPHSSSRETTRC